MREKIVSGPKSSNIHLTTINDSASQTIIILVINLPRKNIIFWYHLKEIINDAKEL
jgi:hypothetical protein